MLIEAASLPRPNPKRLPEGEAVTVCIAAIAKHHDEDAIVAVSDTKLSVGGLYSQDLGAMKVRRLHKYWFAMIAGKFSQHRAIVESIRDKVADIEKPTLADMVSKTTETYISETRRFAEECILSKYGLSMATFLESRKKIGDSLFERTWVEISQLRVDCELLVVGFDEAEAHIFCASTPTPEKPTYVSEYDSPGFTAIGSGGYVAESMLYGFRHTDIDDLATSIYHCCAAKFSAESASDVGTPSFLHVFMKNGELMKVKSGLPETIRAFWKSKGKPKVSEEITKQINDVIGQSTSETSEQAP